MEAINCEIPDNMEIGAGDDLTVTQAETIQTKESVETDTADNKPKTDENMETAGTVKCAILSRIKKWRRRLCLTQPFLLELSHVARISFFTLQNLLTDTLELQPTKLKVATNVSGHLSFVCFRTEEDREIAKKTLDGYKWKGHEIRVKYTQQQKAPSRAETKSKKTVFEAIVPFAHLPYDEQIKRKEAECHEFLRSYMKSIKKIYRKERKLSELKALLKHFKKELDGLPCTWGGFKESLQIDGYQNDSTFEFDKNANGRRIVGLPIGHADGSIEIGAIDDLPHIPERAKLAARLFESFINGSKYDIFDMRLRTGQFKQLNVRLAEATGEIMLIVGIHTTEILAERISLRAEIVQYFTEGDGKQLNVTSIFFKETNYPATGKVRNKMLHAHGAKYITDVVLGLRLRVSATSSIRNNTKTTEVLYKLAMQMGQVDKDTLVLDMCCGSGTIGLCFAKDIFGVKIIGETINDIKSTAKGNEIRNCSFVTGNCVEHILSMSCRAKNEKLLAIIDPPPCGLNQPSIDAIRNADGLNRFLYISCTSRKARKNWFEFSRPCSKSVRGQPFVLKEAAGVDMYPHTDHQEMILLFERSPNGETSHGTSPENYDIPEENTLAGGKDKLTVTQADNNQTEQRMEAGTAGDVGHNYESDENMETTEATESAQLSRKRRRDLYSSDQPKLELNNVSQCSIRELRYMLEAKLKLMPTSLKIPTRNDVTVYFRTEEDRENAKQTLEGYMWKGREIRVQIACAGPSPKRREEQRNTPNDAEVKPKKTVSELTLPFAQLPYDEQIKRKEAECHTFLRSYASAMKKHSYELKSLIERNEKDFNGLPCKWGGFKESPHINWYQNQRIFAIGKNVDNRRNVGVHSRHADGSCGIGVIDDLPHIPERTKLAVRLFESYINASKPDIFSVGHFRQLGVRWAEATGEIMLIIGIHTVMLDKLDSLLADIVQYFTEGDGKQLHVTSIFLEEMNERVIGLEAKNPQHIHGANYITDVILGVRFRISATSSFLINTKIAELYELAMQMGKVDKDTSVLDICCGSGTLGLCFAVHCKDIFGIGINAEAINDANLNAQENQIENCTFVAGNCDDYIMSMPYQAKNENLLAIINPVMVGLKQSSTQVIRNADGLNRIVYISRAPYAQLNNLIDLCRPCSRSLIGQPFVLEEAIGIDICPHNNSKYMVLLFKRLPPR